MAIDVLKLLRMIEVARAAVDTAVDLAGDVSELLSPSDQATLQAKLVELRDENDAGHARLQAKLEAIIQGGA